MKERPGAVSFQGNPLTLIGEPVQAGEKAIGFEVLSGDLAKVTLANFKDSVKVICTVPSLDTPVCDMEIKRFNQEAEKLSSNIQILFISMDLPFAQSRFCQSFNIGKVKTLSDHALASFGVGYGALIKELRLLTRAVFIVDQKDNIVYVEYVKEITQQPNYDKVLSILQGMM